VLPGVLPLEFGIATQIFGMDPHYHLTVCAEGPVSRPGSGFTINASAGLQGLRRAETVIVPGYDDIDVELPRTVLSALRAARARGGRLVSICSGVFVLAATEGQFDKHGKKDLARAGSCSYATKFIVS